MAKLNPRQRKFVAEYIKDPSSPSKAYKKAGYSAKNADVCAAHLLANVSVAKLVEASIRRVEESSQMTAERIIRGLARIAEFDPRKLYDANGNLKPIHELTDEEAAALSSIDVDEIYQGNGRDRERIGQTKKVRTWDKTRAYELLGKHLAMFTDVHKHEFVGDPEAEMRKARERANDAGKNTKKKP